MIPISTGITTGSNTQTTPPIGFFADILKRIQNVIGRVLKTLSEFFSDPAWIGALSLTGGGLTSGTAQIIING